jgi:Flp pilus assembly protein TadD
MASDTIGVSSASLGQAAIRERNYGTALQLLRRAYRADPSPENARWLATAYEEAGYLQLAALYRELAQERRETPKAIQFQAPFEKPAAGIPLCAATEPTASPV